MTSAKMTISEGKTEENGSVTHQEVASNAAQRDQPTFLGQTKASWYIYWICAAASIANIFQGFDSGIYAIIVSDNAFTNYFHLSSAQLGLMASMINLGNVVSNLFIAWWFIWFLGRRYAFSLGTLILLIGVAIQAAAQNFAMLIVGRLIAGAATAIVGTNLAAYQAEVSSPKIRGRVVSFVQLAYQVGVLIAYSAGIGTTKIQSSNSWRISTALQVIPGVILIVVSFTIPESPRWLLERHPDKPASALRLLARIRCLPQDDADVQQEFQELAAAQAYQRDYDGVYTWRKILRSYPVWKRIAYGMATMALGQITGVGALMIYGVLIFRSLGFSSHMMSLLLNVVSGVLTLVATAVTSGGVDKWGRKATLIFGCTTIVISYAIIGALADAYPAETHSNKAAAIVQVIFIYAILMAYAGTIGPCAWIYASEIFPTALRDKGINVSQVGQQATTLWINQSWPVMFSNVGHDAYYILLGLNFVGLSVVVLFWPETKGIKLEHMDKMFGEVDKVDAYLGSNMKPEGVRVTDEAGARDIA